MKSRETQRRNQREWYRCRRAEWIAANGPCKRCGSSDALQVDHIDPATKLDHRVWSWSGPRREAELAKCQVLCRGCHNLKTRAEPRPNRITPPAIDAERMERLRAYWQHKDATDLVTIPSRVEGRPLPWNSRNFNTGNVL